VNKEAYEVCVIGNSDCLGGKPRYEKLMKRKRVCFSLKMGNFTKVSHKKRNVIILLFFMLAPSCNHNLTASLKMKKQIRKESVFKETVPSISVDAASPIGQISPLIYGSNIEWPASSNGLWDNSKRQLNRQLVEKVSLLDVPIIRFPGGSLSDMYHWEYAVGPLEKRRDNLDFDENFQKSTFGTDEFMKFCSEIDAKAMITVNFGSGTPQEAADWVEYCNGSVRTPYGAKRAANGHPEPYNVQYWEVGNEVYGYWEKGHTSIKNYANRFIEFAQAMKRVDPSIKLGAEAVSEPHGVGDGDTCEWNRTLLEIAGDYIDFLVLTNMVQT
jgi:alpha-L-arabinofuranosidase